MTRLPIIVGFGGYNAAGRSSFHHGFRRMIIESLSEEDRLETLAGLGVMTRVISANEEGFHGPDGQLLSLQDIERLFGDTILQSTLIRKIEKSHFDVDAAPWQQSMQLAPEGAPVSFLLSKRQLPSPVPTSWTVEEHSDSRVRVTLADNCELKVDSFREMPVKAAGQLPSNFAPGELYNSRFHPRALQMTIVGVSDALHSMGIPWSLVQQSVNPDEIAVYGGNVFSQMDECGFGGMMQSRLKGQRVTAKQLPLGLNSMVADFVNAYVLGNVGTTGCATGACATFLYNLKMGVEAIQSGRSRVVVVGNSEAPVTQEIIDGFAAMSALGTVDGLRKLEGCEDPDLRRSSRPFGENCGFTIAESTQFVVLMDDELTVKLGAQIYGAVTDVFINADGYKKSISAPGPGNYITLAKAVSSARQLLGTEAVRHHSMVHAHGSSTPANRVTESELFDRVAEAFGITSWPITAVKAYVGHSIAPASGDQVVAALGSFAYGVVPGIKTIDRVADDVHQSNLRISTSDFEVEDLQVAFVNSKGFGGNNATGVLISPSAVETLLQRRYGEQVLSEFQLRQQMVAERASSYDEQALRGEFNVIYNFGENLIDDQEMVITDSGIEVPGLDNRIVFSIDNPYQDISNS